MVYLGPFSPPLTVMGPTAAGEGADSSLVETGRAFAGDESESSSSGGGSVSTAASDGFAFLHDMEVWSVCIAGDRPESASPAGSVSVPDDNESTMPAGSPRLLDTKHLSFGLAKSQIWLFGWIEDRLKINEEVKDEDHSAFLKAMEEIFVGLT
jgi:hypothetical protein